MTLLDLPQHDGSELYVSDPNPAPNDRVTVFARVPHGADDGESVRRRRTHHVVGKVALPADGPTVQVWRLR